MSFTSWLKSAWERGPGWFDDVIHPVIKWENEPQAAGADASREKEDATETSQEVPTFSGKHRVSGLIVLEPPTRSPVWQRGIIAELRTIIVSTRGDDRWKQSQSDSLQVLGPGTITERVEAPFSFWMRRVADLPDSFAGATFAVSHDVFAVVRRPWYTFDVKEHRPFLIQNANAAFADWCRAWETSLRLLRQRTLYDELVRETREAAEDATEDVDSAIRSVEMPWDVSLDDVEGELWPRSLLPFVPHWITLEDPSSPLGYLVLDFNSIVVDPDGFLPLDLSLRGWISPIESISVQALRLEHWGGSWKRYKQLWQERYTASRQGANGPSGIRRLRSRATARRTAENAGLSWASPGESVESDSEASYLSETEYLGAPTDPFTRLQEEQPSHAVTPEEGTDEQPASKEGRRDSAADGDGDGDSEDEAESDVSDDEADLRYIEKHGITSEVVLWESLVFSQLGGGGGASVEDVAEDREQSIPIPWRRAKALSGDLDLQLQLNCEGIPGMQPTAIFFPPDVATTPSVAAQAAVPTAAPEEYWDFSRIPDWLDDYTSALRGAELLPSGPRAGPARRNRGPSHPDSDYGATSPIVAPQDGPPQDGPARPSATRHWVAHHEHTGDSDDDAGVWDVERSTPRAEGSPFGVQELPPVRAPAPALAPAPRPAPSSLQRIRAASRHRSDSPTAEMPDTAPLQRARDDAQAADQGAGDRGGNTGKSLVPSPYSVRTVLRVLVKTKHTSPLGRKEVFRRNLWAERELCVVRTRQPAAQGDEGDGVDGASTPVTGARPRRTGSAGSSSFALGEPVAGAGGGASPAVVASGHGSPLHEPESPEV